MPSVVSVNGAGTSTSDPVLSGLPLTLIMGAETVDIAGQVAAGVDAGQGFPITTAITSSLVPSATTYTPAGLTGTWTNSTRVLTVGNVGTADAGMYISLSLGSTKAFALIEQVVSSTQLKLIGAPFSSDQTNVGYQIAYTYKTFAAASGSPVLSSAAGKLNVLKFQAADSSGNLGNNTPGLSFYVRDVPTDVVVLGGGSYTGQRLATSTPTFEVLPSWTSKGGIATLELVSASGITWWDGTTAERTMAALNGRGTNDRLKLTGQDGPKSAVLRARTYAASSRYLDLVTISVTLDASAPAISAWVTAGP